MMPKYRFEFSGTVEGGSAEVEFPTAEAARADAVLAASEAMRSASEALGAGSRKNEADWAVRVYDEAGALVATIAFSEVIK